MDHNHSHTIKNIKIAFFLNLAFTVFEIIGGLWTNSLAILSDAVHDLGDSFSLGMSWYLEKYSRKQRDARFTYGYRRFSLLAALVNTIILFIGSFFILSEAIPRILSPEPSNAKGMVIFAIVGVLVNGAAVLRLRGGASQNVRAVMLHLLEDVLGWIAVLVVAVILLFADIHVLDPILSILITGYVLFNVIKNLKTTMSLFLQGVPDSIHPEDVESFIVHIHNVMAVHHLHIWSLDGEHHVLTAHVVLENSATREDMIEIKSSIHTFAKKQHIIHTAIEFEFEDEKCVLA
jgi:cobalt-zinc-cadmium efflux system protein